MANEKPTDPGKASVSAPTEKPQENTAPIATLPSPIPGSDIVGRGIYIKPRQPYELKRFLFKDSEGEVQTFTLPASSKTYSVPAGCSVNPSPPLPADQSFGQTLIEESWSRFGKQLTLNASGSVSGKSVSIDATAFQANSVKSDEDSYYAMRSSFVPLWDLYMPSVPDTLCDELVAMIPDGEFEWTNRRKYAEIFERFGTHFVRNVWVGGKATLVFTVAKSSNLKTSEIRAAVQASLGGVGKLGAGNESTTSLETFSQNSSCKVFGAGGDSIKLAKLSEFDKDIYNGWLESIANSPAVIQLGVVGIWTLVRPKPTDKNPAGIIKKAEALREAYVRETTFVPLTAIIPIGWYYVFLKDSWGFALDYLESPYNSQIKTLTQVNRDLEQYYQQKLASKKPVKETPPAAEPLKLENITAHFPFLDQSKYKDFQRPHAALSLSAVSAGDSPRNKYVYLFKNRLCLEVDFNITKSLQEVKPLADGPQPISEVFPGVEFDRIDATLAIPPDKIYLFSGDEYYRIEVRDDNGFEILCREKTADGWPGVDFERLDTATYWKNGKVYFFYEDQFIRYDVSNRRTDPGYPKYIPSNYVEDWDFFE